jgi:hypothetical protein
MLAKAFKDTVHIARVPNMLSMFCQWLQKSDIDLFVAKTVPYFSWPQPKQGDPKVDKHSGTLHNRTQMYPKT